MVSEPTSRALWGRVQAVNMESILPPMYSGAGVQSTLAVSEYTSQSLWESGAGCFSGVRTYLQGTVEQGCMHCGASVQAV